MTAAYPLWETAPTGRGYKTSAIFPFTFRPLPASNSGKTEVPRLAISEEELVARARSGDTGAFDALIGLHQRRVFALAFRMLGNADDAADVQQETFMRAWRSLRKFRGDAAFSTWLHRITVNLCLGRKRGRHVEPLDPALISAMGDPNQTNSPDCLASRERVFTINKVVAALPDHYLVMIVLREIEERPFEEIAGILGCSVRSARMRASKARSVLRERLAPVLAEELL